MVCTTQWRDYFQYLGQRMVRQKENEPGDLKTELRRCLSTPDLTCLGVGNTVGVGIYVLLGVIAKENAGPSTILCFLIAIGVTMLNALVYAEFASSVTQTGASYTFLYKVGGEFVAFLCGWLMIVLSLCSSCVGARAWSGLLDSFFDHSIQNFSKSVFGEIQFGRPFAEHLDLMAFVFQITVTLIVSCNVRCSSILTTTLSITTVSVLLFVAVAGVIFGDKANFINEDHGGFMPFGISGVIKGSSLAIYACSGFEVISMSAEEAKSPQRSVPKAIIFELMTVACVYVAAAVGLLFLTPYWLIDTVAPLPSALDQAGLVWGKFVVTLGPLFSFTNLQMLSIFGTSRVLYRMASDGLFFKFFLRISKKTGVPLNSIVIIGFLTSIMSLVLDLSFLVEITILLMLITYTFSGSALIKLRMTKQKSYTKLENRSPDPHEASGQKSRKFKDGDNKYHRLQENGSLNNLADFDDSASKEDDGDLTSYTIGSSEGADRQDGGSIFFEMDRISQERESQEDDSDCDGGEEDVLFEKRLKSERSSKKRGGKDNGTTTTTTTIGSSPRQDSPKLSLRLRLGEKCKPLIPGVLSINLVVFMHWTCCMGLAVQINYGWRNLLDASVVALLAVSILLFMLAFLTFVLWMNRVDDAHCKFKTPLMPLVPTLSIVFSSILFLSSAKTPSVIEMVVLVVAGSILYFLLVLMDMRTSNDVEQDGEQSMSLIGDDAGSDNDEL